MIDWMILAAANLLKGAVLGGLSLISWSVHARPCRAPAIVVPDRGVTCILEIGPPTRVEALSAIRVPRPARPGEPDQGG